MIETLEKLLPEVIRSLDYPLDWDSLIINRRQPFTYRVFRQFGDLRVCLHKFDPCESAESFPHPHPWPGAFLMLEGEYIHRMGQSVDLTTQPEVWTEEVLRPYSKYEIVDPHTWHSVQPTQTTYTIMCNGSPWEVQHKETRTTKGKDLEKFNISELTSQLATFGRLLRDYQFYGKRNV